MTLCRFRAPLAITAAWLLAGVAAAQTAPRVFVQNAQTVGAGDTVYLYSLPTRLEDGTLQYWDTELQISTNANGKPDAAAVTSEKAPKIRKAEFLTGTYSAEGTNDRNCTTRASAASGRTQFDFSCTFSSGAPFAVTWYTGPIAGHPYEAELRAAGLDQLAGDYAWGKVLTNATDTYYLCFNLGELISARQVGDRLTLTNYDDDTIINCEKSFIRAATGGN
jgi:hypothetical protein